MNAATSDKAVRLLAEGRVQPHGTATMYRVDGDHAVYDVAIGDGVALCSCPARGDCSHLIASRLVYDAMVDGVAETVRRYAEKAA
jgi:hypothetical protein